MNRTIFTGGKVFDGTGAPQVPADVVVRGDRIESVRPRPGGTEPAPIPGRSPERRYSSAPRPGPSRIWPRRPAR